MPIPERLWTAAVELAREHGAFDTARALRLKYGKLKRLLESASPAAKSRKTKGRSVALSQGLADAINQWRAESGDPGPEEWVFPSETRRTPLARDNCWRRWIAPSLRAVGLEWVNFQVMRRTHASLMRELKVDPKIVADQLGHSVDVDLNVYTSTALGPRREALKTFESALCVMQMEYIGVRLGPVSLSC